MKVINKNGKHYQKCDVVMLPTKNPTVFRRNQLWTHTNNGGKTIQLRIWTSFEDIVQPQELEGYCIPQELYILSNDKIKDGDYAYDSFLKTIIKVKNVEHANYFDKYKKIIATTDSSLKLNSVKIPVSSDFTLEQISENMPCLPQIPQSFIEYNLKNLIQS